MMHRLRAAMALSLLLGLLITLPITLAATIGNPLTAWPDIVAGDMSDRAVLAILAAIAWLAWASFAVPFTVELVAVGRDRLGGSAARQWRIPLLGFQHDLARALLVATFLLAPTAAGFAEGASLASASPAPSPPPVVTSSSHATSPTGLAAAASADRRSTAEGSSATTTYMVPATGGLCTYWDLAEHFLGAGHRWPEIWQLNEGRIQDDGSVMTSPQLLLRGWTVIIPATAPKAADEGVVTVVPGDTLSGIAASHGFADWEPIWSANVNSPEPDGRIFSDPDLIVPGWTITLPEPTQQPVVPAHPPADRPGTDELPVPKSPVPDAAPKPGREPAPMRPPVPRTESPARTSAAPRGPESMASAPHARGGPTLPVVFGAGGGLLLGGAALIALQRYRRRQFRQRTPGRTVAATPAGLAATEKALLAAGSPAIPDVTWLDQALRGIMHTLSREPGARLPDLVAARVAADEILLVLATPHAQPPSPWTCDPDGTHWTLARDADLQYDAAERAYHFAPFPALASIGYTPSGESWLIDLERVSAMSLRGDPERCLYLARVLAAELAPNPWSEQIHVTLVGFGHEMAELNPSRLSYTDDLHDAISQLWTRFEQLSELSERAGVDALAGRLGNIASDAWTPQVLIIGPSSNGAHPEELDALLAAQRHQPTRLPIAVIVTDNSEHPPAARWELHLDDEGRLRVPSLGLEMLVQQLPADEAGPLAQLIAFAAEASDEPMPASRGDQPWDTFIDAAGEVRPEFYVAEPAARIHAVATSVSSASEAAVGAAALPDSAALTAQISAQMRRQIFDADPTLDNDLADWRDPDCSRPKLRLLGVPLVTARGSLPEGRPRTDFYTEVVALLATRTGTTVTQLCDALWPNDPDMPHKTTPRQAMTVVRKWLGINPDTGHDYLPYGGDGSVTGVYRIDDILVDAELARRLRLRGTARGHDADGISDLIAALELVQGVPFDRSTIRTRRNPSGQLVEPYSWLVDTPLDRECIAMISDLAHTVANQLIDAGNPSKAVWAAHAAINGGDCSDLPLLDLVAAHLAVGERATAEEYARRIMCNHDAEVEEDLPTPTYNALRRLLWAPEAAS